MAHKKHEDELEELTQIGRALTITREIVTRPLAFDRHRLPGKLGEARAYLIFGFLFLLAIAALVAWLNNRSLEKVDLAARSTAGGYFVSGDVHVNPKGLDLETEITIFAFVLGAAAIGRVLHYGLSFFSKDRIPPRVATTATLYWIGFFCIASAVMVLCLFAAISIIGAGEHDSAASFAAIFVFMMLPVLYVVGMSLATMLEWPRRLYGIRAVFFYPIALACLVAISWASGRLSL